MNKDETRGGFVDPAKGVNLSYRFDKPEYGTNYNAGYIGFSYPVEPGTIREGITWFTRWDRLADIKVSHALIVTGPDSCVEADLNKGVVKRRMSDYFTGDYQLFFRKPRYLTKGNAALIVACADQQIGKRYDKALIYNHALWGSLIGNLLNQLFWGVPEEVAAKLLNDPNAWICSELAAYALCAMHVVRRRGCLNKQTSIISPQELFEDNEVFEEWRHP